MKRLIVAILGTVLCLSAQAQIQPALKPNSTAPNYLMPPGKIYIDLSTMPKPRFGFSVPRTRVSCDTNVTSPCPGDSAPNVSANAFNIGEFRIVCGTSHVNFDDPIVHPGMSGMNHLHQFFGNTKTSSASDAASLATSGNSTCAGGTLNRTGYWSPVFIYDCPAGSTDGCTRSRDGEVHIADGGDFYYKSNNASTDGMVWPPHGVRFIKGNASATTAPTADVGRFDCYRGASGISSYDHIPSRAEATAVGGCTHIMMLVYFSDCWDGVNFDSPDHKSHVRDSDYNLGCTNPSFPVRFPKISVNIKTAVAMADLDYYRLSSDPPKSSGQPAGWTIHADWYGGWDETPNFKGTGLTFTDILLRDCMNKGHSPAQHTDCHVNLLGDVNGDGKIWTTY